MTDSGPSREANRISERLIGVIYTMHDSAPPRGRSFKSLWPISVQESSANKWCLHLFIQRQCVGRSSAPLTLSSDNGPRRH